MVAVRTTKAALQLLGRGVGQLPPPPPPLELRMPEHVAHPNWNPFPGILSAEQGSDKACFADFKEKNSAPSMGGTSRSEINNEMSPGKDMHVFSLLPLPQPWPAKGSLSRPS